MAPADLLRVAIGSILSKEFVVFNELKLRAGAGPSML
jgi:hypothetical protein